MEIKWVCVKFKRRNKVRNCMCVCMEWSVQKTMETYEYVEDTKREGVVWKLNGSMGSLREGIRLGTVWVCVWSGAYKRLETYEYVEDTM